MSKIITVGRRHLKDDVWHDNNGPISDTPGAWDPPMTDEERHEAAMSDPDNPPLTAEQLSRFRRIALAKHLRFQLNLSRTEFAEAYRIPVDTLRAWERHEVEPSPVEQAYLEAIERGEVRPRVTA